MNYIEQLRRDGLDINYLLMNVGKHLSRFNEDRKFPKSKALLFFFLLGLRIGHAASVCWNWFLDVTFRRKYIVRGRRRLMKLAGIGRLGQNIPIVEKVGTIEYPRGNRHRL